MKDLFKKYFVTGLLIVVPITITWLILLKIITWMYGKLDFNILPKSISHKSITFLPEFVINLINFGLSAADFLLAIFIVVTLILFLGMIGRALVVRRLINLGERILTKVPLVGIIYRSSKQLMDALFRNDKPSFSKVVLVEFPREGVWSVGLISNESVQLLDDTLGTMNCIVFVPTAPNITTGFALVFPVDKIKELDMTVEEAFKMFISLGVVMPTPAGGKKADNSLQPQALPVGVTER